ncbi:unnamed protein product [Closterium sp. NIES-65]|nr:unnamed protein product [Closterium sp. NIES-65]
MRLPPSSAFHPRLPSTLICLPPSPAFHPRLPSTLVCLPPSPAFHPRLPSTLVCLPPSPAFHPRLPSTLACLPPSSAFHPRLPSTLVCLPPSSAFHPRLPSTLACLPPSSAFHPRLSSTLVCLPPSSAFHPRLPSTLVCLPPSSAFHPRPQQLGRWYVAWSIKPLIKTRQAEESGTTLLSFTALHFSTLSDVPSKPACSCQVCILCHPLGGALGCNTLPFCASFSLFACLWLRHQHHCSVGDGSVGQSSPKSRLAKQRRVRQLFCPSASLLCTLPPYLPPLPNLPVAASVVYLLWSASPAILRTPIPLRGSGDITPSSFGHVFLSLMPPLAKSASSAICDLPPSPSP